MISFAVMTLRKWLHDTGLTLVPLEFLVALKIHLHATIRKYSTIHARVKSNNGYHVNEEQHKIGFSVEEKGEHIHRFPKSIPIWRPHPHNIKSAITI